MSSSDAFGTPFDTAEFVDDESPNMNTDTVDALPSISRQDESKSIEHGVESTGKDNGVHANTHEQTRRRLWADNQKMKWDQFEPWMFEEFGSFVDII